MRTLGKPACWLFALTLGAAALGNESFSRADTVTQAGDLVTVELFTSQGCSACPAADALLGEFAERPELLALSLPVDYWDYLGWRDTLARPEHTKRQYAYTEKLGTRQPYTPQIVVDGREDVVGNDKAKIERAIRKRTRDKSPRVAVTIETGSDDLTLAIGAGPKTEATVWLVRYVPFQEVLIGRGENRGRTLRYSNVVRSLSPIGMWAGEPVTFRLTQADLGADLGDEDNRFAIIVQGKGKGPILGAARIEPLPVRQSATDR